MFKLSASSFLLAIVIGGLCLAFPVAGAEDLLGAAERGDLAAVRAILTSGTRVNTKGSKGETALLRASRAGRGEIVALLLEKGADVNAASGEYKGGGEFQLFSTPLMEAVKNGHTAVARMLIERGAKVGTASYIGMTPLKLAARRGDPEAVGLLLSAGADVNHGAPLFGRRSSNTTALMMAANGKCWPGHGKSAQPPAESWQKTVELLLRAGARADIQDQSGRTAFILAAACSPSDIAPMIMRAGVSVDDKDNQGLTTLSHAASRGDLAMATHLLENRADPNIVDRTKNTPLLYAVRGRHTALVEVLAKAGANVNVPDQQGKTALMIAVEEDDAIAVNVLLAHGADLNAKTELGLTALQLAKLSKRDSARAILESLERAGARE